MIYQFILLVAGVFTCSTAVIMIKASTLDPVLLSASRLMVAVGVMYPLYHRARKRFPQISLQQILSRTWLPGLFLSAHYISWVIGARLTPAANASLIVNMTPVVMPFLLFWMMRERVNAKEIGGTILALSGVIFLSAADYQYSSEYALGDAICFGSMLTYALYITFARKNKDLPTLWLYVVPVYALSGLFCTIAALGLTMTGKLQALPEEASLPIEIGWILALGIIPTVFGHSLINNAMKHLRGQIVAIVNLGQFLFAGVMAYFFLQEVPHKEFYIASILLVSGVIIALSNRSAK